MEASLNHGKSLNGKNSSVSSMNNQKPCGEMFVTSGWEVLRPGATDFIQVLLNQPLGFRQSFRREPLVPMQFNRRICRAAGTDPSRQGTFDEC